MEKSLPVGSGALDLAISGGKATVSFNIGMANAGSNLSIILTEDANVPLNLLKKALEAKLPSLTPEIEAAFSLIESELGKI